MTKKEQACTKVECQEVKAKAIEMSNSAQIFCCKVIELLSISDILKNDHIKMIESLKKISIMFDRTEAQNIAKKTLRDLWSLKHD